MGKNEELVALVQQGEDVKKNIELLYNNNIGLLFRIASRYRGLAEMEAGYIAGGLNGSALRRE